MKFENKQILCSCCEIFHDFRNLPVVVVVVVVVIAAAAVFVVAVKVIHSRCVLNITRMMQIFSV